MDSSSTWLTARRNSPTISLTNFPSSPSRSGMTSTSTSDPVDRGSPQLRLRPLNATLPVGYKSNVLSHGRPCLAGTQASHHQANLSVHNTPGSVSYEHGNDTVLDDITHDSSGFGSLLVDNNNASIISNCPKSTEHPSRWRGRNTLSLDCETSDLGFDHSGLDESTQSPTIQPSDYPQVAASAKSPSHMYKEPPQAVSTRQFKTDIGQIDDSPYDENNSNLFTTSGRESRMLEENLASVARYVEELTGSAGSGANLQVTKQIEALRQQQQLQSRSETCQPVTRGNSGLTGGRRYQVTSHASPLMSLTPEQQQQIRQNRQQTSQLQQLQQQLAALQSVKTDRSNERASITQTQEILLRLLANQFPDLVMNTNAAMSNCNDNRQQSWVSTNTSPLVNSRVDQTSSGKQTTNFGGHTGRMDGLGTMTQGDVLFGQDLRYAGAIGSDTQRSRSQSDITGPDGKNSSSDVDLAGLLNYLPNPGHQPHTQFNEHQSSSSANNNTGLPNASTMAVLASLFNVGLPHTTTSSNSTYSSSEANSTTATTLAILLANLQERTRSVQQRESSQHPVLNETEESQPGFNPLHQQPSTSALSEELVRLATPYQRLLGVLENDIDWAANMYRNSASTIAQKSEAAYHWSGRLPVRVYRSMTFSRKVFLGGVPWDSTSDDLIAAFSRFGNVMVSWPQQDGSQLPGSRTRSASPKGYCYLIFEHEASVNELLATCVRDPASGGDYYKISSSKFKSKDVQVIPWVISDSQYTKSGPFRPDSKRTVFIGALHGMITAEALVTIMNDLFGNVVFAALDTDKYKYPIGSGRVAFSSHKSYMRAVTANFVDVRTSKFVKTIQIDPYLEDSLCNSCLSIPGIYFCRAFECFRYFCPACWQLWHSSTETLYTHKPLRRTFKPVSDRACWTNISKY